MPKPKVPKRNPIQTAVQNWIVSIPNPVEEEDNLIHDAPKRFTIYEPMALLPTGSFTHSPWTTVLGTVSVDDRQRLWSMVLKELSTQAKGALTHLAVNEGIPLHREGLEDENVLRSPSGLRILYGNFGSSEPSTKQLEEADFNKTLWVSTKQNGIYQTWAPKWTMFSRGNIKEKARVLGMGAKMKNDDLGECWAVDLYAGIGYFVFSYARLGLRVLCWEINPWSVEGLRRGAEANKWTVKVVQGEHLSSPIEEILSSGERIVVFQESNEEALQRIQALQSHGLAKEIRHINCGFLPTSEPTWRHAWGMTLSSSETWLHLHENVGVNDTEARRQEIQRRFDGWKGDEKREGKTEHVELVKTFAPGVWHCVFDVHVHKI